MAREKLCLKDKNMTITFQDFGLSEALNTSLRKMDYKDPTPIQQQAIPIALSGKDVLGSAQTGTGKTAAFSIPLVEKLLQSHDNSCALVLTPTRELAKQVLDVIHQLLGPKSGINTAFIIGGEPYRKQFQQLERNPRIIVGTPGRINDHLDKGAIDLSTTDFLVLDETDRMLDMGFGVQLDRIVKHLPKHRQTLMFSATLPNGIIKISDKYLNNPKRVSVGETNDALHGDLRQHKRDKVMRRYREKNFRILVATDIAARGLDVPHIEHVINYDLPQVAEDYIHRMGRTARAGAEGSAVSFVSSPEGRKWHAIEMLLDPEAAMNKHSEPADFNRGRNKGRGKPYRGRPASKKSEGYKGKKDGFKKRPDARNDNAEGAPKKKRKEKYIAKADRVEGAEGSNKPKKPHFKKKNDVRFEDTPEGKFVSDRKPKKKKGTDNKPNSKKKPKKGKSPFADGNAPMRRKVKKKKSPQR